MSLSICGSIPGKMSDYPVFDDNAIPLAAFKSKIKKDKFDFTNFCIILYHNEGKIVLPITFFFH